MRKISVVCLSRWLGSLLLLAPVAHASPSGEEAYGSRDQIAAHERITLTYEEFRRSLPEKQVAWVQALQEFNRDIERIEARENPELVESDAIATYRRNFLQRYLGTWFAASFGLADEILPAAQAAVTNCQTFTRMLDSQKSQVCMKCGSDAEICRITTTGRIDSGVVDALASSAQVDLTSEERSKLTKTYNDQLSGAENPQSSVDLTPRTNSQPLSRSLQAATPPPVDPGTGAPTVNSTSAPAAVAATNGTPVAPARKAIDTGSAKGNDNIDADEYTNKGKHSCIYAGWAVENAKPKDGAKVSRGKCHAISTKTLINADGKATKYSCKKSKAATSAPAASAGAGSGSAAAAPDAPAGGNSAEAGTADPDKEKNGNKDGSTPVLCNPVIFGLNEDGTPVCVGYSKNATQACQGKSKIESAKAMLAKNASEYRKLVRRAEELCQGSSVQGFTDKGKADLDTTCKVLRDQMSKLDGSDPTGGGASGSQSTGSH